VDRKLRNLFNLNGIFRGNVSAPLTFVSLLFALEVEQQRKERRDTKEVAVPSMRWLVRFNLFAAGFWGGLYMNGQYMLKPGLPDVSSVRFVMINVEKNTPIPQVACERLREFQFAVQNPAAKSAVDRALDCDCEFLRTSIAQQPVQLKSIAHPIATTGRVACAGL
jgi:hypothetical protein